MSSPDIHCSTSDSSDPSFGSSSEDGETNMLSEGSDFNVPSSNESDGGNIVGAPPIDYSDDEEYYQNHMGSDSDNDYDQEYDAAAFYEAVPDNICLGNIVNEEDQLDLDDYTDENIKQKLQSLLSSILMSDGSKSKIGYTAEEVSFMSEKMLQLNLSQITEMLMGSKSFETLATQKKSKVDMAHVLVQNNWLIFEDGKFFPKIDYHQTEIVKQIIRGAEAEQRRVEINKKVTNEFESAEIEIRAMKTYNYLIALISRVRDENRKHMVSYQMLIDAHNEILEGTNHNDISQKFENELNFKDHGAWSPDWFKHFTSRSSLKKFVKMSQFSAIKTDLIENRPMFGFRDEVKVFRKEDFMKVREKWTNPEDQKNRNYSRDQRQPRRKMEEEPDENYEARNITFDSDDDYEEDRNRNRNRNQSNQPPARFIGSAFGGPPIQPVQENPVQEEQQQTNHVVNNREVPNPSNQDASYDDDVDTDYLTSSDGTDGFFSDDSDATKQRKTEEYERKRNEKERKKLLRKKKRDEKKPETRPVRAFQSAFGNSDNEDKIESHSSNNTKKSYASTSALPVTSVNSDSNLLSKSTRPQVPHEPSEVQLQKNRDEESESSRRRMNRREEGNDDDDDEKTKEYLKRKQNQKEMDKKRILEEERIEREKEERQRKEIEERKRQEKEDEEFARRIHAEERTWDGNDYDRNHYEQPQTGKFGLNRQNDVSSPSLNPGRGSTSRHPSTNEDPQNHFSSRQHSSEMRERHHRDAYTPSNHSRRVSPNFEPKAFHSYAPPNHQVHRPQPTRGNDMYFADFSSSSNQAQFSNNSQYNQHNYSQPPRQPVTNNRYGSSSSNQGFGSFAAERDRVHANMSRNSTLHSDNDELRVRIFSFIDCKYRDGELVTDEMFYRKYPYKLPEGFRIYDFVSSYMMNQIDIKGVGDNSFAYIPMG